MASPFQTLPDDVLQRLLAGVPLDDHQAAAATCQAFRAVIRGPRFLALRQTYGFAERGVVVIEATGDGVLNIRMAQQNEAKTSIYGTRMDPRCSTTDGSRMFISTSRYQPIGAPNCILAVNAYSGRWKRLVTLPRGQSEHCMEWHGGNIYVAGGVINIRGVPYNSQPQHDGLHAFNEATALWDDLPPMPHAVSLAVSGVIGNRLFIAGGYNSVEDRAIKTLQIYDIGTRTWRLGAPLPDWVYMGHGVVVDEKLFVFDFGNIRSAFVYDPQSDTWTEEDLPPGPDGVSIVQHACAHKGRIVIVLRNNNGTGRTALERVRDGLWSPFPYEADGRERPPRMVSESVLLG